MLLSKNRIIELVQLLEMIKNLEIPDGALERKGNKAHLQELFLSLCELVVFKEIEVKEIVKEIFVEYYKLFITN